MRSSCNGDLGFFMVNIVLRKTPGFRKHMEIQASCNCKTALMEAKSLKSNKRTQIVCFECRKNKRKVHTIEFT